MLHKGNPVLKQQSVRFAHFLNCARQPPGSTSAVRLSSEAKKRMFEHDDPSRSPLPERSRLGWMYSSLGLAGEDALEGFHALTGGLVFGDEAFDFFVRRQDRGVVLAAELTAHL